MPTSIIYNIKLSNQFFRSVINFLKLKWMSGFSVIMKDEERPTSSANVSLSRETVEEDFIETYKNLPLLWDTGHKHKSNKYKRNEALDVLLKIIKRWNPSATRMNVRQKINILRSTYRKDRRKYLASKYIGPKGEEIYEYEPKNWKFHALKFLEKNTDSNDISESSEINKNENQFEDEDSNDSVSENGESISQTSDVLAAITAEDEPQRKRLKSKKNKFVKVELEDDYYEPNDNLLDRELEAIGANVTCKLKRMNSLQRYHAELLINKVLISGLKNNLTDDTDLTDV